MSLRRVLPPGRGSAVDLMSNFAYWPRGVEFSPSLGRSWSTGGLVVEPSQGCVECFVGLGTRELDHDLVGLD